ncbi:MAG TPA: NlpC/P60 family protein [Jatrophihabitans sp.]|nr:NlpC/P60 family protein [Jatrophihabitans sp.]
MNRRIVAEAARHLGQHYVFGATGPRAFDCSGLVYFVYRKEGVRVPRQAQAQFRAAHRLRRAQARRGDLVFYHERNGFTFHVAIYTGHGNTIVAANPRQGVIREHIWSRRVTFGSFTHRR